ncbi:MAG: hypothetical protein RLZZ54_765 [Cyanobacteriota bacterium]
MPLSPASSALQVQTGPAGRAIAQPMEVSLLEALQHHLTMERQASATYFAMAVWFAERELRGFAHFFKGESADEQQHAARFADYLIARGQTVILDALVAPYQQWSSPEEILTASFRMEADVTASLQQMYGMAERCSDVRTTTFLDPIVDGQVTSENRIAHLMGRVRFAQHQPAALLLIDGELSDDKCEPASLS